MKANKLTPSQLRMKKVLKPIVERILNEADYYYRADKSVVGNELYIAQRNLTSLSDRLRSGNDFHPEDVEGIIKLLQIVLNKAEKFDAGTIPIDKKYR